jgi:hypothetical protein
MTVLLTIHSIVRWTIVLVAVIAIVKFAMGWLQKQSFDKMSNGLSSGFNGLMDLQATLGVLYFLLTGFGGVGFPAFRIEHAVTMIIAVAVAHSSAMWKKKDDTTHYRNTLFTIVLSLLIIFVGIVPLGGWTRWWHITGLF